MEKSDQSGAHSSTDIKGNAEVGRDFAARDIVYNFVVSPRASNVDSLNSQESLRKPDLFELINRIFMRSPGAIETKDNQEKLARGEYRDTVAICLPFPLEDYSECFNQNYPISKLIAYLIYLRWGEPFYVDLNKLEEEITALIGEDQSLR